MTHRFQCPRRTTIRIGGLEPYLVRWLWLAILIALSTPAFAAKLRVVSESTVDGYARRLDEEQIELRGTVSEKDLRRPIPGASVFVTLPSGARASGCKGGFAEPREARLRTPGSSRVELEANSHGDFCVRCSADVGRAVVRFAGDDFRAAAETTVELTPKLERVAPRFVARMHDVSLDRDSFSVHVTIQGTQAGRSVRLDLSHQPNLETRHEDPLATLQAVTGGSVKFDVPTDRLGKPGVGRLVVRHPGSLSTGAGEDAVVIRRSAVVSLSVAAAPEGADPQEGIPIRVGVGWQEGAVPTGWVEVELDKRPVGVGIVSSGSAEPKAIFDRPRTDRVPLRLRYVPKDPWWLPSDESLEVVVTIGRPSPWVHLPWLLVVIGVAVWVVRAWRRPGRMARARSRPPPRAPGRAEVRLIEQGAAGSGWRGRVIDAHDGTAIGAARVEILVPTFDGSGIAASTLSDDEGRFSIDTLDAPPPEGASLRAASRFHRELAQVLPPPGVLVVALVTRRRAVLDRLVAWAQRRGPPWSGTHEPTPGHVARVAKRRSQDEVATWALAVQDAAFGPAPLEEAREQDIAQREPGRGRSAE